MQVVSEENYRFLQTSLSEAGLYSPDPHEGQRHWRISPDPCYLNAEDFAFFQTLGTHLVKFYTVLNQFYFDSVRGKIPGWFADYLDLGKPPHLVEFARMKRFRSALPGIIRPDVMVTEGGFSVTELDSVPGGFGLMSSLMPLYQRKGDAIIGLEDGGIPDKLYRMFESASGTGRCRVAIVVSDEAADYLEEMKFLGNLLKQKGLPVYVVHPRDILFKEDGLFVQQEGNEVPLDLVYRFFELFDLKNIPKSELIMFANKKGKVKTTPPYKPFLEEKLAFSLFHHPALKPLWEKALGGETFDLLRHLIPDTWILDSRKLPPHAVIPGLEIQGRSVRDWTELFPLSQSERELVVKTSGFSPQAWGSRGVVIGHDVSSEQWQETLEDRLNQFENEPSILQKFHKGKRFKVRYFDPETQKITEMQSRVRLTPYYFVIEGQAELGGIMATFCPQNKKKIHGMSEAVIVPCATRVS